jgi:beta-phosphoglucomutase
VISAVLFDFDGVIVDSERLHWSAFNKVLEPYGKTLSWSGYFETYIGFDDREVFRRLFPGLETEKTAGLITAKAAAFQSLLERDGAAALPGAVEMIRQISGQLPLAICSGALREDILPVLGTLGIESAFDVIVTAEETPRSKPDPAPYIRAWEKLAAGFPTLGDPAAGLAIEDTPAGIASARGAGLKVLAVTNSYPGEELTAADVIVDSLEGLSVENLDALI